MTGEAFIVGAMRTPVAPRGKEFRNVELHQLGTVAVRACLEDAGVESGEVDELIVANALGAGGNPARLIALQAGLPETVAGLSIDRQCCGGLDALILAKALVASGQASIIVAGGAESYSRRPLRFKAGSGQQPPESYDQAPFTPWPDRDPGMAAAANELAECMGITRQRQDDWAVESHRKARNSFELQTSEITGLDGVNLDRDSFTRNLSDRICRRARVICGTVTHANASVAADAAAFCAVVSARVCKRLQAVPVRLVSGRTIGSDPTRPGLAPVGAIGSVLNEAGVEVDSLMVAEIMEAYAVQAIACVDMAGINPSIVNPGGGSLARGHPIGASGAILAVRLVHELRRCPGLGLAAIAAAGGLGSAAVFAV